MFSNKRNEEKSYRKDFGSGTIEFNEGHEESGAPHDVDVSSGMSGGFSADSKEEYEAAEVDSSLSIPREETVRINDVNDPATSLSVDSRAVAVEFRKLNSKMNSIVTWIKSFYSNLSQVIEEVNEMGEKMEENQKKSEIILKDVEDLKKRAEVFIGTEELLKLNDEIKENLDKITRGYGWPKNKKKEISTDLLEKTAILAKQNKEALGKFTFEDYEEKMDSMLKVVEESATQISEIRESLNSSEEKSIPKHKSKAKKSSSGKNKKESEEKSYEEFLEDMGQVPELPELPPQKTKKNKKKKNK